MKTILLIAMISLATINTTQAQLFITKNGKITFFSKTPAENIDATNNQVVSVLDSKSGSLQFSVQITGFLFKKGLMQDDFNGFMESDKFPKSTFKGLITNLSSVNFSKDGTYAVTVTGDLTIHGVTNKVTAPGTISISGGKINATSTFNILVADYKIKLSAMVQKSISNSIEIKVDCNYQPK